MVLFRRKKEEEIDVKKSKEYSRLESFVKEFEIGFGEKFYKSSLFGNTPFFDSESKKVGVLPADIYQIIEQFNLNRVVNPSNLKRKNIENSVLKFSSTILHQIAIEDGFNPRFAGCGQFCPYIIEAIGVFTLTKFTFNMVSFSGFLSFLAFLFGCQFLLNRSALWLANMSYIVFFQLFTIFSVEIYLIHQN